MRYQIYEAKSVKYDAQQRVGIVGAELQSLYFQWFCGSFLLELHFDCIFLFNCSVID